MRRENTVCKAISIFAYTNRFRPDLPTDYIYQTYYPLVPTSDLNEIVGYAVGMLRSAWKGDGKFNYKKAGVLVWNIVDSSPIQGNLFDTFDREKRKRPDEMSELEKLRAEVKILKAEKERAEMEASFLKKLEEIERRRG